ncbi:hypothetical protein [Streptomyces sp. PSKA30]|uniref:hypothetical protein n=1 Tax=Streptomyces sp. PSKA30 TaxID=2874597 RepID=UPI001CD09C80|nr:hypothetical protein [Streptomyces sp. PSKA30]MBZ9645325.1 hypothetical protein [Streptomyces sp. PSKA30]
MSQVTPGKFLFREIDKRAGTLQLPLLSVSQYRGVVPRSALTDDLPRAEDLSNYKVCAAGDIVVNRMSAYQGAMGRSPQAGIVSPDYMVLRPGPLVEGRYLHHVFRSTWFRGEVVQRLRGIGSVDLGNVRTPRINPDEFGSIPLTVPSLEEQRRIADFLDIETARIDQLAAAMTSQDDLLRHRRLRLLDSVRGSDYEHAPLARLGYFSSLVTSGSRGWSEYVSETGELFFRSANLHSDRIQPKLVNSAYVQLPDSEVSESRRARIRFGDCLIGITGANAGWVCLADASIADGYVSQHVCLVRPDSHRLDSHWLALLMASPCVQSELMGSQYGGTKTQLSLPDVRAIRVPVLPIRRQVQLARSVNRQVEGVDQQRALRRRQLTLLTERRQALITAAVTGQFDATTASGRNVTEGVAV